MDDLNWAFTTGKTMGPTWTDEHYKDMLYVCGVTPLDASRNDFQRYFKCKGTVAERSNDKGLHFPNNCSVPPCDQCNRGKQ